MRKTIFNLIGLFLLTCMFTGCGGGSKSSSSSNSAYEETYEDEAYEEESSVNFQSGQQVYTYILGKRFRQGQFRLEIRQDGIYMNGQCVTGAPRVDEALSRVTEIVGEGYRYAVGIDLPHQMDEMDSECF